MAKRTEEQVDQVREETKETERKLKAKKRERAKKKDEPASLTERLVAPILLVLTLLISYLVILFS